MNKLDLQPRLCLQRQIIDFHTLNTTPQLVKLFPDIKVLCPTSFTLLNPHN